MKVKRHDGKTGYISMGFAAICDVLRKVDPKKDLPAEVKFVRSGSSWTMV
jgi:hypothetical protein